MLVLIGLVFRLFWTLSFSTFIRAMGQTVCKALFRSIRPNLGRRSS